MPSFYIPLSGLNSDSTALNTIANNLANMNTTGFKSQSVNFSDLFHQQVGSTGSGDPIQLGSGTKVASIVTNFTTGSSNSTGADTDVALQGDGFFLVSDGGTQLLTRAGDFSTDSSGKLITTNGLSVMGYPSVNGVVNTKSPLTPIVIPKNQVQPPEATTTFCMNATLDSSSAVGSSVPATVQVYDSLGKKYDATVTYTKVGTNAWSYSVSLSDTLQAVTSTLPAATTINYNFGAAGGKVATVDPSTNLTITGGAVGGGTATTSAPALVPGETLAQYAQALNAALATAGVAGVSVSSTAAGQLSIVGANISTSGSVVQTPVASAAANGSLTFDSSGNLVGPAADVSGITFAGLSDGAATMNMTWNLFGADGKANISQVNQTSAVASTKQDGYASGAYSGFSIGSDGTVTASFKNGQKLNVGQLALGNVANLQGLEALGDGDYAATMASGTVTVGTSGISGLGSMEGGALEASNVNISAEFSNLIIAQRSFEANSKAVTTFDTVTQETINMIR